MALQPVVIDKTVNTRKTFTSGAEIKKWGILNRAATPLPANSSCLSAKAQSLPESLPIPGELT
jgi:hypothetical protein